MLQLFEVIYTRTTYSHVNFYVMAYDSNDAIKIVKEHYRNQSIYIQNKDIICTPLDTTNRGIIYERDDC